MIITLKVRESAGKDAINTRALLRNHVSLEQGVAPYGDAPLREHYSERADGIPSFARQRSPEQLPKTSHYIHPRVGGGGWTVGLVV